MKKLRMNISHPRFILSKLKIFGEIVTTFILTYPIDLICLDFVANGERCQHKWRTPLVWDPQYIFRTVFLPILKIIFV